ncbi:unnamed protein product, partial [Phaeothamnion confervicola]
ARKRPVGRPRPQLPRLRRRRMPRPRMPQRGSRGGGGSGQAAARSASLHQVGLVRRWRPRLYGPLLQRHGKAAAFRQGLARKIDAVHGRRLRIHQSHRARAAGADGDLSEEEKAALRRDMECSRRQQLAEDRQSQRRVIRLHKTVRNFAARFRMVIMPHFVGRGRLARSLRPGEFRLKLCRRFQTASTSSSCPCLKLGGFSLGPPGRCIDASKAGSTCTCGGCATKVHGVGGGEGMRCPSCCRTVRRCSNESVNTALGVCCSGVAAEREKRAVEGEDGSNSS